MNADFQETNKDPQTDAITGAAMEVHRQPGYGFPEAVYQEAPAIKLADREIPFQREVPLPTVYKGVHLQCSYRAEVLCLHEAVVAWKASSRRTGADTAQTINELKATRLNRAWWFNFGASGLEYKHLVFNLRHLRIGWKTST